MKYLKLFEEYNKIPNNLTGKRIFFNRIKKNFELEKMRIYFTTYEKTGQLEIYYENFHLSAYKTILSIFINGKKSNVGKNLDFEIYRFFIEKIKEIQTFEFQKKFLTEHPDKLELLEQFGFAKGIKEEFTALFRAKEW